MFDFDPPMLHAVNPTVSGNHKSSEPYCEWELLTEILQKVGTKGVAFDAAPFYCVFSEES